MPGESIHDDTLAFMNSLGLGLSSDKSKSLSLQSKGGRKQINIKSTPAKRVIDIKSSKEVKNIKSAKKVPEAKPFQKYDKKLGQHKIVASTNEHVISNIKPKVLEVGTNTNKKLPSNLKVDKMDSNSTKWWLNEKSSFPMVNLENETKWFDLIDNAIESADSQNHKLSKTALDEICAAAEDMFKSEMNAYQSKKKSSTLSSDQKWMEDVISKGTLSDKVAALALRIQDSPVHQLDTLDILVSMSSKKEQRVAQLSLEALKDLLLHNLLPNRRLKALRMQSLGHSRMDGRQLILFKFEEELSLRISRIVDALELGLRSNVEYFKRVCMDATTEWIMNKPEQESRLLRILVNKIGDPSSKICTKSFELLKKISKEHPLMVSVIAREVWQLIARPNASPRALYAGVVYLVGIRLSPDNRNDEVLATQLVEYYIGLFERAISQEELGSRLLSALLTGINRAFPVMKDKTKLLKHVDALFRIVHQSSFSSSTQALTLLSHIILDGHPTGKLESKKSEPARENAANGEVSAAVEQVTINMKDRYYRALYSALLSDQVSVSILSTLSLHAISYFIKLDCMMI